MCIRSASFFAGLACSQSSPHNPKELESMFRIPLVCAYCFLILAISLPAVAGPLFPCPRATSSSNGQFLVLLLEIGPVSADEPVLQIYRRDHKTREGASSMNQGAFVKGLSLKVLWPTKKLPSSGMIWTDESLQWFAGGSFAFSSDSRQLIHKTRWGNTARNNLMEGSIASNTCLALTCMDAPWADY